MLLGPARSPRSGGAVGVGDVAGERGPALPRAIDAVNRRDLEAFSGAVWTKASRPYPALFFPSRVRLYAGHDGCPNSGWNNWFVQSSPTYNIKVVRDAGDLGDVTIATISAVGHGAGSELPSSMRQCLAG